MYTIRFDMVYSSLELCTVFRAPASATFRRLISQIDTVSRMHRGTWSDLSGIACRNCTVGGQNKRLSPEGRFQDRNTNAIIDM